MGNFSIPRFNYIVNSDDQVQLYGDDGTGPVAYSAGLVTPSAGKVSMRGELDWFETVQFQLFSATSRIKIEAPNNGTYRAVTYVPSGDLANVKTGHVFRVVTDQPSKENTAYQNIPVEKRYQIPRDCTTEDEVAEAIADAINADDAALVTAQYTSGAGVKLIDNHMRGKSNMYVGLDPEGNTPVWGLVATVNDEGTDPINTYDALKDEFWAKNVDFDRNAEYFPERGAKYKGYSFKLKSTSVSPGGHTVPSQVPVESETEYTFYVKEGLDFETAMSLLAVDMNV